MSVTMSNYLMLDGRKIEISKETAENLKKEFTPKELEHVWKHGDVSKNEYGSIRIFISLKDELRSCSEARSPLADYPGGLSTRAREYGYEYLGNIFDGSYCGN